MDWISDWANGSREIVAVLPARGSAIAGTAAMLAELVKRNLPGRSSRSTLSLIASISSGARWTSSITAFSIPLTKPTGSARRTQSAGVIKGDIGSIRTGELPGESGLYGLAGANDQDNPRVGECRHDERPDLAVDDFSRRY